MNRMKLDAPILHYSDYTPPIKNLGLKIQSSAHHGGVSTNAVWVHGVLVLSAQEKKEIGSSRWMKALNVFAIGEVSQPVMAARVIGNELLVQDHWIDSGLNDGSLAFALPFSFDLRDALGRGLFEENVYVHVSALQYHSEALRVIRVDPENRSFLEDQAAEVKKYPEVNRLIEAYDACSCSRFRKAVELFTEALKNESLCGDLDRPNLRNAALVASRVALDSLPEDAERMLGQAWELLQKDLEVRRGFLSKIHKELARNPGGMRRRQLEFARARVLHDMEMITGQR